MLSLSASVSTGGSPSGVLEMATPDVTLLPSRLDNDVLGRDKKLVVKEEDPAVTLTA